MNFLIFCSNKNDSTNKSLLELKPEFKFVNKFQFFNLQYNAPKQPNEIYKILLFSLFLFNIIVALISIVMLISEYTILSNNINSNEQTNPPNEKQQKRIKKKQGIMIQICFSLLCSINFICGLIFVCCYYYNFEYLLIIGLLFTIPLFIFLLFLFGIQKHIFKPGIIQKIFILFIAINIVLSAIIIYYFRYCIKISKNLIFYIFNTINNFRDSIKQKTNDFIV